MKYKALVDIHYTPFPDNTSTWIRWRPGEVIDTGVIIQLPGYIPFNLAHLLKRGAVEAIEEEVVDDEILE